MIPGHKKANELHKLTIVDERGLQILEFFISKKADRPGELLNLAEAIRGRFEQEERGGVSFGSYTNIQYLPMKEKEMK